METRRFLLAIALSFLFIVTYMYFFGTKPAQQPAPAQAPSAPVEEKKPPVQPKKPEAIAGKIEAAAKGEDIVVETEVVKAVVNTAGGAIKSWELKNYREADKEEVGFMVFMKKLLGGWKKDEKPRKALGNVHLAPLYEGIDRRDMTPPLTLTPLDPALAKLGSVEYRPDRKKILLTGDEKSAALVLTYAGPGGISIEKRLTFHRDEYRVDLSIQTRGFDGYRLGLGTDFGVYDKLNTSAGARIGLVAMADGKKVTESLDGIKGEVQHAGRIDWFGNEDKYFTAAIIYGGQGIVAARKAAAPREIGDLLSTELTVKQGAGPQQYALYAGPKSYDILKTFGKGMEQMVDFGWFTILAKPMFWLMMQFYKISGNYGIAIIFLTIVVRALLFYPSLSSAKAMEEMKGLQPEMTAVREKYKKDPKRMNEEMMKLYKSKKVNPMGGCLPMLLQLPFFIALYNVLSVSIELRQSPFISFWIKDLSVHDPYYILPVLMGVSMIVTMKMTSTTADPQQQKMFMIMNVLFIFLFAWLPAGLLLYITLSNVLSIVQQLYVRKILAAGKA